MSEQLNQLELTALAELPMITTSEALQAWNGRIFGTKRSRGALDEALSVMASLSREERPIFGRRANDVKQALLAAHEARQAEIRGSYFPFTEPSVEIDEYWGLDTERDKMITKGTGWLKIAGADMVHPIVLRNGGYDPGEWSGFAFGMGPGRTAMKLFGINDIRHFWSNDLQFLEQL